MIIDAILSFTGLNDRLTPTEILGLLAFISVLCQLVGKFIPDDKTGVAGVIRKICKILGLYISNRVNSQQTLEDIALGTAKEQLKQKADRHASRRK